MENLAPSRFAFSVGQHYNTGMEVDEFFAGRAESRLIFDEVLSAASSLGPIELRVSKTQIALAHGKAFAWAWVPEMHLRRAAAPLVLSLSFRERRPWPRWKEIYQAAPTRFMHHLELWSPADVDQEVRAWLREAWEAEVQERRTGVQRS